MASVTGSKTEVTFDYSVTLHPVREYVAVIGTDDLDMRNTDFTTTNRKSWPKMKDAFLSGATINIYFLGHSKPKDVFRVTLSCISSLAATFTRHGWTSRRSRM
jgi:hypothetical protein